MRRKQASLGYWLSSGSTTDGLTIRARLGKALLRVIGGGKVSTGSFPLDVEASVASSDVITGLQAVVADGIGSLAPVDSAWSGRNHPRNAEVSKVCSVAPLPPAESRRATLPGDIPVRVRSAACIDPAAVHSLQPLSSSERVRVRSVTCLHDLIDIRSCSQWLTGRAVVRNATREILAVPQAGSSVDLREVKESERAGFLHEAEVLKGIHIGSGELLAIFRNVPIELVSRMSFDGERRAIHFNVALSPSLRRTRVHDLAAVRDISTGEIHLVPHRVQYRTVFLN